MEGWLPIFTDGISPVMMYEYGGWRKFKNITPDTFGRWDVPVIEKITQSIYINFSWYVRTGNNGLDFRGKDKLWGVPIFSDGNITIDSTPDAIGGLFSKGALCYVMSKEWSIERERDASLRGWELVAVADYGAFELVDKWGCELKHDATALVS